jgi:hypothetical protein
MPITIDRVVKNPKMILIKKPEFTAHPDEKYFRGVVDMVNRFCDPKVQEGLKCHGIPTFTANPNDKFQDKAGRKFTKWIELPIDTLKRKDKKGTKRFYQGDINFEG